MNEARFGYNRSITNLYSQGANGSINYAATVFGFKDTSSRPVDFGVPWLNVAGFTSAGAGSSNPNASTDSDYQWVDNLSIVAGRHNVKMGFDYIHEKYYSVVDFDGIPGANFSGQYTGSALGDFLLGIPYSATASVGDGSQHLIQNYYAGYLQDNWRPRPNLSLNLGLRYEFFQTPYDTSSKTAFFDPISGEVVYSRDGGVRNGIVDPDWHDFAPRIGFAYSPGFLKNTVVRGAYGIFYGTDNWNELQFENLAPEFLSSQTIYGNPITPNVTLQMLFPTGTLTSGTETPFSLDKRNRTPYIQEWDFDLQHTFGSNLLVDLGYLGNTGQKLYQRRNLNVPTPDPTGTIPITAREPYPDYSWILWAYNGGWSSYNALALRVEKRVSGGLYLLGSYTYSHALDLGTTDDFSASECCFKILDKGNGDADVRQRLVLSYVWELPFGHGKRFLPGAGATIDRLLGGWEINGITTFSTGQYLTPILPVDWQDYGTFSSSRPDQVGSPTPASRNYNEWSNISAYVYPGCPSYVPCTTTTGHIQGNAARDSIEQPGLNNWDFAIVKDTRLKERLAAQFRAEFFNGWNHEQFGQANNTLLPGIFGVITSSAVSPREIQFALKLTW